MLLSTGGAEQEETLGSQQWMQGQMPAPAAHPAVLQAMLQAAAVGGQCMPPMAAMYMAAAFSGRPPGLLPLQQQVRELGFPGFDIRHVSKDVLMGDGGCVRRISVIARRIRRSLVVRQFHFF